MKLDLWLIFFLLVAQASPSPSRHNRPWGWRGSCVEGRWWGGEAANTSGLSRIVNASVWQFNTGWINGKNNSNNKNKRQDGFFLRSGEPREAGWRREFWTGPVWDPSTTAPLCSTAPLVIRTEGEINLFGNSAAKLRHVGLVLTWFAMRSSRQQWSSSACKSENKIQAIDHDKKEIGSPTNGGVQGRVRELSVFDQWLHV